MRPFLIAFALVLGSALPAAGLTLDLPVRRPGEKVVTRAPAYAGDVLEVQLTPAAARIASARNAGQERIEALGTSELDRLSDQLGVWFRPEFLAETAPPEGSPAPDFTAFYVAHLPATLPLEDALERFRGLRDVVRAHPIAIMPVSVIPNDSLWSTSYWFFQALNRRDIHAPEAWNITTGDTSIVVAILDTGVVPYHPDLGGRVAGLSGNIWTNWGEAGKTPNFDDDGNLLKDDIHGWDFVSLPDPCDCNDGEDGLDEDNDPNDFSGHGTEVAGLAAALTDNTIGVAGAAPRVRLMPLRMGWSYQGAGPSDGEVRMDFAAAAVRYATRKGATVINCSWESAFNVGLDIALTAAVNAGITVVSASGNRQSAPHYVGDRDDCLAIAATDADDIVTDFSVLGPYVDLAAPGAGLSSTFMVHATSNPADSIGLRMPAYRSGMNGTSFSTPLVSGAVALIQSQYVPSRASHRLTPRSVQLRLMETADDISDRNTGLVGQYGAGRLNTFRALTETSGSIAIRTLSPSVGASALIPSTGEAHVAYLTENHRLLQIEPVTQDTVMNIATAGTPVGDVAAADLGPGIGPALFYATSDAGVSGRRVDGAALPGTWPQPALSQPVMAGPALGDLDGDGTIEVVSGGNDGQLFAWHMNGTNVSVFPIQAGGEALGPAALSDLDGNPGAEIIVAAADGQVHAYTSAGIELTGWPQTVAVSPRPPVVMRLGTDPSPAVVVAAGNQLYAFSPAGDPRAGFPVTLGGSVSQDLAVADVDGDGHDDIVVATPNTLDVRDSAGVSLAALGWPRALSSSPLGPPVLGELSTASAGPEVLLMDGTGLLARERDGDPLATLPKPGGAGAVPSIGQTDADAHAEILAGTGTDAHYYVYDGGPGSAAAGPAPWPTPRANYARTGSRLYSPPIGGLAGIPAQVVDLQATAATQSSITLEWTASGDDGMTGRPRIYAVRAALTPLTDANFDTAPFQREVVATVDGGGAETYEFSGLAGATTYFFALKAVDGADFSSPLSNVVEARTNSAGPLTGRSGVTVVAAPQPALGAANLYWLGSAGGIGSRQTIRIYDLTGRRVRTIEVGTAATGVVTWDGRDDEGRFVPAGLYSARLVSGSVHAETRIVMLR